MLLLQHVSTIDGYHQGDPVGINWTKHIPVLNYITITRQYTNKLYCHQLQSITWDIKYHNLTSCNKFKYYHEAALYFVHFCYYIKRAKSAWACYNES